MTSYQGGKQRLGKKIYQVIRDIENQLSTNPLPYLEPFVGYAGVLKHFAMENERKCYATDLNRDVIEMWKALQNGWVPDMKCSQDRYETLKLNTEPSKERGLYGILCSFGAQFFRSYRKPSATRDYVTTGVRKLVKVVKYLSKVIFLEAMSYENSITMLKEHDRLLIYCDPPYFNNNISSSYFNAFSHDEFWETIRVWSRKNIVVVSEYQAPTDFICIWREECTNNYPTGNKKTYVKKKNYECLFIHSSIYNNLNVT